MKKFTLVVMMLSLTSVWAAREDVMLNKGIHPCVNRASIGEIKDLLFGCS